MTVVMRTAVGGKALVPAVRAAVRDLQPIAAGTLLGLLAGLLLSQAVAALLFEVAPTDPAAFAVAAVAIGLAGTAAAWVAARRAGRVDPAAAFRSE